MTPSGPHPPAAKVVVTPASVTPRQTVRATVTADAPIDEVGIARLDWGYVNFYSYRASAADGDRETDDWVSVIAEDFPIATGATPTFRIPSWAPASSPSVARWECRLTIDRGDREIEARGEFTVAVGTSDVDAYVEPMENVSGAAETVVDLTLSSPVYRAGDVITGQVTLTPTVDLSTGDLTVSWLRQRASHPLTGTAGADGQLDGRMVHLGKRIPLHAGVPTVFDFELPLPADAPPTAAAVHSSIDWFVQACLTYSGSDAHPPEQVRRPVLVVNAD